MSYSETLERRFQLYRLLYHILCWSMFCTLIMLYTGPIEAVANERDQKVEIHGWRVSWFPVSIIWKAFGQYQQQKQKYPKLCPKATKCYAMPHTQRYRCALMNKHDDEQNDGKNSGQTHYFLQVTPTNWDSIWRIYIYSYKNMYLFIYI